MANCSPDKIIAALHEEAETTTDIVREKIKNSDRLALRMVPDGGTVRRHANNNSVIYGEARQAPVAYRNADHSPRDLVSGGQFPGRTLAGSNGIFEADQNDIDDNACHGQVTIDFSQGFRIRRTTDRELSMDTPIKCARELDRLGEQHIRGYFEGFRNQFSKFGLDNFSDNLLNLLIQYSEANASVIAADQFNVTSGGWQAPPVYRITIHFLQDYRLHIMAEMKGRGLDVPEDWMLEVEMPRDDWFDAVIKDQVERNPTGTVYNSEVLKDDQGPLRGRQFAAYGGIKCYFNETPIRGYFKQSGTSGGNPVYQFVRVYDWINAQDEEGGIVSVANHQYREDTINVDGILYPMVTLIPHIDQRSFKRYGLVKPLKPYGTENAGVNYEVRVIDGARLGCNDFDDKFKFAARHEFRFKAIYPELSGFIAYRHGRRTGYTLAVTPRDYSVVSGTTAFGEEFQAPAPDGCMEAECQQCGKVSDIDGTCVDPGSAPAAVLELSPAGANTVGFYGSAFTLKALVYRTVGSAGEVTVAYATADVSGSGDAITATSGTLTWEVGDMEPKEIEIPVLATADDTDSFTLTISSPTGATIATGANVATFTIDDLS